MSLDAHSGLLRAWPVCLRSVAVRHVRDRVRGLRFIPRTSTVLRRCGGRNGVVVPADQRGGVVDANALVDWILHAGIPGPRRGIPGNPALPDVRAASADGFAHLTGEGMAADDPSHRRNELVTLIRARWREAPDDAEEEEDVASDSIEWDEDRFNASVADRYGPVLPEDIEKLDRHLQNLTTLIAAAMRANRDHWTSAERAVYCRLPEEVVHNIEQDAALMPAPSTPEEFRRECNLRLHRMVDDPLLSPHAPEAVSGESQLRPRTVYPS